MSTSITQIYMHADVSRALDFYGKQKLTARGINLAAFEPLIIIRRTINNYKAAARNAREEYTAAAAHERKNGVGSAYDAGFAVDAPKIPAESKWVSRVQKALDIGGLPADLEKMCREFIAGNA